MQSDNNDNNPVGDLLAKASARALQEKVNGKAADALLDQARPNRKQRKRLEKEAKGAARAMREKYLPKPAEDCGGRQQMALIAPSAHANAVLVRMLADGWKALTVNVVVVPVPVPPPVLASPDQLAVHQATGGIQNQVMMGFALVREAPEGTPAEELVLNL